MEATPTVGKLNAVRRAATGKGIARKLRGSGRIPAVCYGRGTAPIPLMIDPEALRAALDPQKGENTLIELTIEGEAGSEVAQVMVKDYQLHPIKQNLLHTDFVRVEMNRPIRVMVPLVLTGKSVGVTLGGILHQVIRDLPMHSLPDRIPSNVELDVTPLQVGDGLRVSDLSLGEGITVDLPASQALVQVVAPRAAEVAGPAEGEAGEEGAEGEGEKKAEGAAEDKDKEKKA